MNYVKTNKKLLYEHEVLWACYEIRDYYLKKNVKDIYENIGQVLSLVRVQLDLLTNENEISKVDITQSDNLVGKAIQDLRIMSTRFYPETELLAKLGLIQSLEYELKLLEVNRKEKRIKV